MPISKGYKQNFSILRDAAKCNDLALVECTDKATGNKVYVVCAVNYDGVEYEMVPIAKMFDGNPYDEVEPPS